MNKTELENKLWDIVHTTQFMSHDKDPSNTEAWIDDIKKRINEVLNDVCDIERGL